MNNVEKIKNALKDKVITAVYVGQDSGCRCGCNGKYYRPSDDLDDDDMYMMAQQALDVAENEGVKVMIYDDFINISYGDDMAYTIYYE